MDNMGLDKINTNSIIIAGCFKVNKTRALLITLVAMGLICCGIYGLSTLADEMKYLGIAFLAIGTITSGISIYWIYKIINSSNIQSMPTEASLTAASSPAPTPPQRREPFPSDRILAPPLASVVDGPDIDEPEKYISIDAFIAQASPSALVPTPTPPSAPSAPVVSASPLPAPTPRMTSRSSPGASSSSSSALISFTASDDFDPPMTYSEFVGSIDDEPDCPREQSRLTGKTSVSGRAWIYTKNSSTSDESLLDKFHLSIHRDDIERCFPLVFPLTRKFKTDFKVLRRSEFSDSDINSNAWGKEFVFYVPKANTPGFLADIMPIIQSFGRLTPPIRRSLTPLADVQVKGSDGYLYHRDDHSITGQYVEATLFRKYDFTLSESAKISGATSSIDIETPRVPRRQKPTPFDSHSSTHGGNAAYLHADAGYFFERCLSPRNKVSSTIQGWMMRPLEWHGFTLKEGFLDHYLDHARAIIDTICLQLDPKKQWEKHRFAEVTPSIYYDFIIPLYRGLHDEGWNINTLDLRQPFRHRPDLEKRLIQNIVLCSFREPGVQDQSLSPQYISIVRNNWAKFNTLLDRLINEPHVTEVV